MLFSFCCILNCLTEEFGRLEIYVQYMKCFTTEHVIFSETIYKIGNTNHPVRGCLR